MMITLFKINLFELLTKNTNRRDCHAIKLLNQRDTLELMLSGIFRTNGGSFAIYHFKIFSQGNSSDG